MKSRKPLPAHIAASLKTNPDAPASKVVRELAKKRRRPSKRAIKADDMDFTLGCGK